MVSDQPRLDRVPKGEPPYDLLLVLPGDDVSSEQALEGWAGASEVGWLVSVIEAPGHRWSDRTADLKRVRKQMKEALAMHNGYGQRVIGGVGMGAQRALDFAINGDVGAQAFIAVAPPLSAGVLASLEGKIPTAAGRGLRGMLVVDEQDVEQLAHCDALRTVLVASGVDCDLQRVSGMGREAPPDFDERLQHILHDLTAS